MDLSRIKEVLEEDINEVSFINKDIPVIMVKKERLIDLCKLLKEEGYSRLVDLFGIDNLGKNTKRFEVVYQFSNIDRNSRVFIKVSIDECEELPTLKDLFKVAKYYELECSDMFGIKFKDNPLPKDRFLLISGFEGYPLRKDFPLV